MTPAITLAFLIVITVAAWRWARAATKQRRWLIDAVGATAVYVEAWALWTAML